jgi:hypothetical protein
LRGVFSTPAFYQTGALCSRGGRPRPFSPSKRRILQLSLWRRLHRDDPTSAQGRGWQSTYTGGESDRSGAEAAMLETGCSPSAALRLRCLHPSSARFRRS